jgi:hypothetical protein
MNRNSFQGIFNSPTEILDFHDEQHVIEGEGFWDIIGLNLEFICGMTSSHEVYKSFTDKLNWHMEQYYYYRQFTAQMAPSQSSIVNN